MRWMILSMVTMLAGGCSANHIFLRPVAVVRDGASETLRCDRDEVTVRRLGTTAYEQTADVDAYVAEGCGQVAWFVCDDPGGTGECLAVPERPYQPPAPSEQTALVQVSGAWRDPLPGRSDRYWERVSFGDGYSARYAEQGGAVSVQLRPTARRIHLSVGPSWLEERTMTTASTEYHTTSCYRGGELTTCTTAETTYSTYRWNEREHGQGCSVDVTLEPAPGAVYDVEYEVRGGECRARCTKLDATGPAACEGWAVLGQG